MKNPVLSSLLLLLSGLALAADRSIFATSDPVPGAIDPGFNALPWGDETDVRAPADSTPLDRLTKQADAGRAKAAYIVGRIWLERIAENPENCAKAIQWFTKADKLGSNEAPAWLGHVYRRLDCPQRDVKVAIEWLRKAVPLLSFGAAADLADLYADAESPQKDPVLAYAYARVAAESHELPEGDPSSPGRVAALEQGLDSRQVQTATDLSFKLLADVSRRRTQLIAAPREEKIKAASSGKDWSVNLVAFDDLRECAANTATNCRGVRRSAYFDTSNKSAEYLRCKLELDSRDFALGTKVTNERDTILPPKATRRLFAGRIGEVAGAQDLRASCAPLTGLAANVAAGQCRLTTTGVPSVSDFYPAGSKARNEEGRVVVNVWMDKKEGQPTVVELKETSGFPELDVAGVKMGTYMAFKGDCDQGYTSVAIAFRLAD